MEVIKKKQKNKNISGQNRPYLLKPLMTLTKEMNLVLEYLLFRPHHTLLIPYQGQTPADTGGRDGHDHQSWPFRAFLSIWVRPSGLEPARKPTWAPGPVQMRSRSSVTWAPGRWWRSPWWKSSSRSWSRPRTGFRLSRRPAPPGPAACFRQRGRCSWGRRCSACARSPSRCRSQGAAGRWRRSPRCPYEGCLMRTGERNK